MDGYWFTVQGLGTPALNEWIAWYMNQISKAIGKHGTRLSHNKWSTNYEIALRYDEGHSVPNRLKGFPRILLATVIRKIKHLVESPQLNWWYKDGQDPNCQKQGNLRTGCFLCPPLVVHGVSLPQLISASFCTSHLFNSHCWFPQSFPLLRTSFLFLVASAFSEFLLPQRYSWPVMDSSSLLTLLCQAYPPQSWESE